MQRSDVQIDSLGKLSTASQRRLQNLLEHFVDLKVGVLSEKDVVFVQPEWSFPTIAERREGRSITIKLALPDSAVEFPLWPKMEDFGSPGEDGYEEEKERRQSLNLQSVMHDWLHDGSRLWRD